ncbi:uncharacterized protein LOC116196526 [Punica granatum]|uniref:PLAC8 motif-containing protein n=2 Tax=Punica granatum TaxID=22663 RepID=A0A218WCH2_PUNGR|nr:uncharacterized protein LOC116196526 [Punica granatum]OWM69901.1 hypothetical protein CDL15_Pgr025750 [Punica granatum]PKI40619.1 hypothetical protein CRG98_039029 [Punica granatum]
MAPTGNGNGLNGEKEMEESDTSGRNLSVPFNISSSRKTLLTNETPQSHTGFQGALSTLPGRLNLLKFGSASAKFRQLAEERDKMSRSVASSNSHGIRERIIGVFSRKIDWGSLLKMSKQWIRDPMNLALFIWIVCVAVSGAILFLVMTGMLNKAIPKKSARNAWFEVNNQILNALFTLMCLYQHPKRFYHLVLLCRWKPEDISRLRKIYCKNGTYKPHEWAHMMVVVILLHINCFAQYALCGLNVGYKRSERPAFGVGICISVAIGAPAVAGLYTIISPLGKDYVSEFDEESQLEVSSTGQALRRKSLEKRYSFALREQDEQRIVETSPRWSGGILDFWNDISIAYLSLFCSCCVFGWNMERLRFGNMYVHIATFILFCMAPFWIFNLAAVNIDNEIVREVLSVAGILLCLFGLLYGGFWRIQMRKRYNLPPYKFCFGKPAAADCALWLCCCWCSLAQEVRTSNSYDIMEEKFCVKRVVENDKDKEGQAMSPLPREDQVKSGPSSPSPGRISMGYYSPEGKPAAGKEEAAVGGKDEPMSPPAPLVICKD